MIGRITASKSLGKPIAKSLLKPTWMIVGLGNPGARYAETRHNIGWMVVQAFAARYQAEFQPGKGDWYEARCTLGKERLLLMLPTTYMNASGKAAAKAQQLYGVPLERIVAVVDEYNFPVGKIHLKNSGSDGGHNGMASMIQELGGAAFLRLRCGIDRNFAHGELVDYVLKPFADDEHTMRDAMIQKSVLALETLVRLGTPRAMQLINADKLAAAQPTAARNPDEQS
jgi:PTH1 family peptidyl-tRNA hydrolase